MRRRRRNHHEERHEAQFERAPPGSAISKSFQPLPGASHTWMVSTADRQSDTGGNEELQRHTDAISQEFRKRPNAVQTDVEALPIEAEADKRQDRPSRVGPVHGARHVSHLERPGLEPFEVVGSLAVKRRRDQARWCGVGGRTSCRDVADQQLVWHGPVQ